MDASSPESSTSHIVTFSREPITETAITVRAQPAESVAHVFGRVGKELDRHGAEVLKMDVFGPCAAWAEGCQAIRQVWDEPAWPVTWVEGGPCNGAALAGVQVHAVAGADVDTVVLDERPVGRVYQDTHARYAYFGDIRPRDASSAKPEQTHQTFENLVSALRSAGMDMSQVVRTWLYNDHILDWYDAFNAVRTRFFAEHSMLDGLVPASTGIGASNPAGQALVAGALAFQPLDDTAVARGVPSPLQCPAPAYGSTFSRAVELATPDHRRLLVSGTAGIEPGGQTAYVGNVAAQVELTMQAVGAILDSCRMSWPDVTRAVAYCKQPEFACAFDAYESVHSLDLPAVRARADICRDDLLFEIELDAMAQR